MLRSFRDWVAHHRALDPINSSDPELRHIASLSPFPTNPADCLIGLVLGLVLTPSIALLVVWSSL